MPERPVGAECDGAGGASAMSNRTLRRHPPYGGMARGPRGSGAKLLPFTPTTLVNIPIRSGTHTVRVETDVGKPQAHEDVASLRRVTVGWDLRHRSCINLVRS